MEAPLSSRVVSALRNILRHLEEGTLEALGQPIAQGPQATSQRAARCALPLEPLARGHGGPLQVFIVPLRR